MNIFVGLVNDLTEKTHSWMHDSTALETSRTLVYSLGGTRL